MHFQKVSPVVVRLLQSNEVIGTGKTITVERHPFYTRTWFWGVVAGVVVAGTVAGLAAGGVFKAKSNNGCPTGYFCPSN